MSDTHITRGIILKLAEPVSVANRSTINDAQDDVRITYNGKFAYKVLQECLAYDFGTHIGRATPLEVADLIQALQTLKLNPDVYTVQPFFCHWHDGSDFPIDMVEEL